MFDFYGQLLTERQRALFQRYYQEDLSLGEIAEELGISRQAVYDILRRAERVLWDFERKLGLVARHRRQTALVRRMEADLARADAAGMGRDELRQCLRQWVRRWREEVEEDWPAEAAADGGRSTPPEASGENGQPADDSRDF